MNVVQDGIQVSKEPWVQMGCQNRNFGVKWQRSVSHGCGLKAHMLNQGKTSYHGLHYWMSKLSVFWIK